ncbi:MAG: phospholipase D-like domain-containing protein, partial [Bacteroidaceae bacterium]
MRRYPALFLLFCYLLGLPSIAQQSDSIVMDAFRQKGFPFYTDNEVTVIPTGVQKYQDLFESLQQARKFIHMDYFKFQQDSICNALFSILSEKARQGVEVRIVYDSFGNRFSQLPLSDSYLDSLRSTGIQIWEYDRVRFPWINHLVKRNHHKIAVIDGEVVYTGGMNVADYYLH